VSIPREVEFHHLRDTTIVGEPQAHFRDKGWAVKVPRRMQGSLSR
jgi:hypothetical protein